ncbi:MAG TPA: penicillin-binding transpeptidase domain-containing protein [Intrasporangium sp.]|uniref:penicillin-binding transpeptidase domain-containing protein n=1 Tax=Intrasporangium sp. TaxID=1925024 RepID=UPI002D77C30B|nr:penicillin-binding transpeptidase domain-containing protein [Intrasporangium sp.]HET7399178.1 penicillin-binding transpeptidase domain-containing protein [Intrasporangium sp.]
MTRGLRRRTRHAAAATVTLLVTLTGGCSLLTQAPEPGGAAQALATGLASGDLRQVRLGGATPEAATAFVQAAYRGMGDLHPAVTVTSVTQEGSDQATVMLYTRWDVSSAPTDWGYETRASLRLVDGAWQVAWTPSVVAPGLASDEVLSVARKWPRRADIVDAGGTPLMTEREVTVVGLDKTRVPGAQAAGSATRLATVLGTDAKAYAAKVAAAGPQAFVPALTLRATDPALTKGLAAIDAVPGASRQPRMQVLAPTRTWAAPILGSVAEASAEQVKKASGRLQPGDEVGQSGLQLRYDEQLRGTPGLAVQAVRRGADGSVLGRRELFAEQSTEGTPLRVSLDSKAQNAAEAALAAETARPTALVAIRPSTGEVLAAAVGPGAGGAPLALAGRAAPGSTFKIASSLAMVRKGATADTPVPCTPTLNVGGRTFGNYSGYPRGALGAIPLRTALAHSCNTAFLSQHAAVSQDELITAAHSLGMGEDLDLPFAGFLGSVPPTRDVVEHAASFIGQGRVEASPLTMAVVLASVIKGQTVRPRLVLTDQILPAPTVPLDPSEAEVLRAELRAVVQEGSGKVLAPAGVEYAKTGTAEFGTSNPPKTHAWMVAGRGDLAIAAYNEEGPSGSTHAAPFILSFLKAYDAK